MKSLAILAGGTVLFGAVLCYPGYLLWGQPGLLHEAVALGLCLVPALATMVWGNWPRTSPEWRVVAFLGGSGVRLLVSLGGGFLLYHEFPDVFTKTFWIWMTAFYLFILTLEVILFLKY